MRSVDGAPTSDDFDEINAGQVRRKVSSPQGETAENNTNDLFDQEFLKTPITAISVSELISIITKINSATVMTKLQNIDTDISNMKNGMKNLQETRDKDKAEFNQLKATTNKRIKDLEESNNQYKETTKKMSQILSNHQQTIDTVEFKRRECNIIVRGVPEKNPSDEEADQTILENTLEKIGVHLDPFPSAKRLGKHSNNNKYHRAILIQCESKDQVDKTLTKAKDLANLPELDPARKIFFQRDLPPSVREGNYKLRQQLKVEKAKTENAGAELRIDYKKGTISRVLGEDDEVVIFTNKQPF